MKNNMICRSLICCIPTVCMGGDAALVKAAREVGLSGVKIVKQTGETLADVMDKTSGITETLARVLGVEAAQKLGLDATKEVTKTVIKLAHLYVPTSETVKEVAENAGAKAAKEFGKDAAERIAIAGEKLVPVAWFAVTIYAGTKAYDIAHKVQEHTIRQQEFEAHKKEREASELQHADVCEYLKARKALRESVYDNAKGEIGAIGLPVVCEDDARRLVKAGGAEELGKIIMEFNKWFAACPC